MADSIRKWHHSKLSLNGKNLESKRNTQIYKYVYYFLRKSAFDRIVLLSSSNVAFLLEPGDHQLNLILPIEGESCGLIPLNGPCKSITTSGLEWNLSNSRMEFGGLVSTSNRLRLGENIVSVDTTDDIIWTSTVNIS